MKKLLVLTVFLALFSTSVFGATWCQWSGTEGENCRNVTNGRVRLPSGVWVAEKDFNEYGYYELTITQPSIGPDQTRDVEVWDLVGNQMGKTWSVRDLTDEELDQREAGAMPLSEYYLWKTLLATGVITVQQVQNNLPQVLIDAYQARDRIENP